MMAGGWGLETSHHECQRGSNETSFEDDIVQVLYQRVPDIPTKFLSFRQTSQRNKRKRKCKKTNANAKKQTQTEVKHALEEDTPGHGKYSHLHTHLLASVGTQSWAFWALFLDLSWIKALRNVWLPLEVRVLNQWKTFQSVVFLLLYIRCTVLEVNI